MPEVGESDLFGGSDASGKTLGSASSLAFMEDLPYDGLTVSTKVAQDASLKRVAER